MFLTLEDETGVANIVVWPKLFERYRPLVMGARLLLVRGRIQHAPDGAGFVTHLVAEAIEDRIAPHGVRAQGGSDLADHHILATVAYPPLLPGRRGNRDSGSTGGHGV